MNSKEYKVGETWTSPDGDKCKSYSCIKNNNGEIIKQESIESCQRNCSKGWEYKESTTSCCGICEPVACVLNDTLKYANDEWKSEDGCITFRCEFFNDQMAVTRSEESCPNIDNCPPQDVYIKNCCKHCNITNGVSQVSCESREINPKETVGLVNVNRPSHGNCANKYELKNFKECSGRCHSSTVFNSKTGSHESKCECCQATKYEPLFVELECEDGYKYKKQIAVPVECGCESCSNSFTKTGGTKSSRKTG
ncbi:hemocytin-like [Agrilus planipennis]|nr:hemocytin-like [Agrilus planipennis]